MTIAAEALTAAPGWLEAKRHALLARGAGDLVGGVRDLRSLLVAEAVVALRDGAVLAELGQGAPLVAELAGSWGRLSDGLRPHAPAARFVAVQSGHAETVPDGVHLAVSALSLEEAGAESFRRFVHSCHTAGAQWLYSVDRGAAAARLIAERFWVREVPVLYRPFDQPPREGDRHVGPAAGDTAVGRLVPLAERLPDSAVHWLGLRRFTLP